MSPHLLFYIRGEKMARSEALKRAQKRYELKKPTARIKAHTKSEGKRFILNYSTTKDLFQYLDWIHQRLKQLEDKLKE